MKASKEIEKEFHLIKAEQKLRLGYELKPVDVPKVQYGKSETKRAITNVLNHVLPTYKYASLAELNAVLKLYNIVADRGSENSRIYQSGGLVYRILTSNGEKVGVPVKASLIYCKPTLKNIEARFEQNETERQQHKRRLMNSIDFALLKKSNQSITQFSQALQKEKIHVVFRQNESGLVYGITYVDHHTKCVFNGSHLGKQYNANGIQQRCNIQAANTPVQHHYLSQSVSDNLSKEAPIFSSGISPLFDSLVQPETNQYAGEPSEQKQFKNKTKRRQQQTLN